MNHHLDGSAKTASKLGRPLELHVVSPALLGEAGVADGFGAGATLKLALLDHRSRDGRSGRRWRRRKELDHGRRWSRFLYHGFWIRIIILDVRVVILDKISGGKKVL